MADARICRDDLIKENQPAQERQRRPAPHHGHNLAERVEKTVAAHHGCLRQPDEIPPETPPEVPAEPDSAVDLAEAAEAAQAGRIEAGVEADDLPHLHRFVIGIRRDYTAVRNGLALPHSFGSVEGNVNRIKMIKRRMYGHAGFDLLRKRILLAR